MNQFRLALIGTLLSLSTTCFSQSLWQGTTYGMTLADVRRAVPEIQPPQGPPETLKGGAQELLEVPEVDLVGKKFKAMFYFADAHLVQVTLSLEKGSTFSSAMLTYNSLVDALRAKYGQEISNRSQRALLNMATAEWLSGKTNLSLLAMAVGEQDAIVNLNYQVRISKEAEKL